MALILQLSDLHLSSIYDERQTAGDFKIAGIVPIAERPNRLQLLRSSLAALETWLDSNDQSLDAIVVSGDVSLQFDDSGFAALETTLDSLGAKRLPNDHIVVVPGNHDVKWETDPSTPERYEQFVQNVRDKGFVTPLLEGIDLDDEGNLLPGAVDPVFATDSGSVMVIAMNTANYCGSVQDLSDPGLAALVDLKKNLAASHQKEALALLEEFEKGRKYDVARVSPQQLAGLRTSLLRFADPADAGPIRTLAMHHQLLPVSPNEEFKPFENLSNLGQVREFLVARDVSVVMHGHKHHAACYEDAVVIAGEELPRPNTYLVSSAGTVWSASGAGAEFARFIDIDETRRRAPIVVVKSIASVGAGADIQEPAVVRRWLPKFRPTAGLFAGISPVILGQDANQTYERLLSFFETSGAPAHRNLVCVIKDGPTALTLPEGYPGLEGIDDKQTWLDDIVAWWQRPDPDLAGRGRRFNHGERIYDLANTGNQLDAVITALGAATETTRGVVQLVDPLRDDIAEVSQRIPAFFTAHFVIDTQRKTLNVTGHFRKQQVRMWWPVNVAELAFLQGKVLAGLAGKVADLTAGTITTVAGVAVDGSGKPRVVVPRVDRLAQDSPDELWILAYDLIMKNETAREQFSVLFDDWRPTGRMDADGSAVSLSGMKVLAEATRAFADRMDSPAGKHIADELQELYRINVDYSTSEEHTKEASAREIAHQTWRHRVDTRIEHIQSQVSALFGS